MRVYPKFLLIKLKNSYFNFHQSIIDNFMFHIDLIDIFDNLIILDKYVIEII